MKMLIKKFFIQKFAELLNHLYFYDAQTQGNFLIIVLFFIQKGSLLLLSNQHYESENKDIYFYVCEQFLQWGTFQKPLQMIASDNLNLTITLIYELFQIIIIIIFCFSLYQKQFISTYFSFYQQNFQLIILYQVEIHILIQNYSKLFSILLIIPLYINYFIILYCSRNYLLLQKINMIKKFSYYNFIIMTYDFFFFIIYDMINQYVRNFVLFILFLIYFFDALNFKPYYSKLNNLYLHGTFILVIIAIINIFMWNSYFQDQIYNILIFSPLLTVLMSKIKESFKNLFEDNLSLDFILDFGDQISNDYTAETVQGKIGLLQIQKFCQFENFNINSLLKLLETYQHSLEGRKDYKNFSQKILIAQEKEEIQLYIIFLYYRVQGTYLQSLLKAKQYQIENENHSLFFSVISTLISQKYDQQVKYNSQNEQNQAFGDQHKQLIEVRKVQIFYTHNIQKITQILDYKIFIWSQILSGFDYIEELLQLIIRLYLEIKLLESLNKRIKSKQNNDTSYLTLKNMNILSLRYFSFYNSQIMNDFQTTLEIELFIDNILTKEKNKLSNETLIAKIINSELIILSASILQCKGLIFNGNIEELSYFFGIDALQIKYYQNISQLMPTFINQNHNLFIDNFISKGISDLNNKTKIVYCQDGQNFVFPIELSLIHINEQSQDFILTAILQKIQSSIEQNFGNNESNIQINYWIRIFIHRLIIKLDKEMFDCYIQFWIPNIFLLIDQSKESVNPKNDKKLIDIAILKNCKKIIEKLKQDLSHQSKSNLDQFLLSTGEYPDRYISITQSFQTNTSAQISIEVIIEQNKLPNNFTFYSLQIHNLQTKVNKSVNFDGVQQENQHYFKKISSASKIQKYQSVKIRTEIEPIEDLIQTKRQTDSFQKSFLKESQEKNQEEKLLQNQFSLTCQNHDNIKDLEIQKKENIHLQNNFNVKQQINGQKYTDSQSREIIKEILENNNKNKHLKLIFYLQFILQIIIFLLSYWILNYYFTRNSNLQAKLQLMTLPNKFNRIYCSFTMMGQVDLERILKLDDNGEYINYRVRNQSNSVKAEINEMMPNLKNEFSKLEEQDRLPLLNIRIISQNNYEEYFMMMLQFNLLAEFYVQDLNYLIQKNIETYNTYEEQIKNQYFKIQFLKANLINQISSSQKLIDEISKEIEQLNLEMLNKVEMLFIMQILILFLIILIQTYIWKQPYTLMKLLLQLITIPSNELICQYIQNARYGKQIITKQSWKQINYYQECFGSSDNQFQSNYGHNKHLNQITARNKKEQQRLKKHQFNFFYVYLKNFLFMSITASFIISGYIYLNYNFNISYPAIKLTIKFAQFKQDLDSIMILSFLLKTNIALTEKALELGFLDQNPYLLNQSQYFSTIYSEILLNFSTKVPQAKILNDEIFIAIINQDRMKESDKEIILNLYSKDLCSVLQMQLPFCAFSNNSFTYFPDYPIPQVHDNNREIFKTGISGIFLKILEIFQSDYNFELQNQKDFEIQQKKLIVETQNFKLYIEEYFFDINRAIITLYTTLLASILNILTQDFNYILQFYLIIWAVTFIIQLLVLVYCLLKFEFQIKATRYAFTLLPQECLSQTKCLSIIKLIYKKYFP